jgi:hypothetical protein
MLVLESSIIHDGQDLVKQQFKLRQHEARTDFDTLGGHYRPSPLSKGRSGGKSGLKVGTRDGIT